MFVLQATLAALLLVQVVPGQTPPAPAGSALPKPERLTCIERQTTGSRLHATKICKTRTEWERDGDDTFDQLQKAFDKPTGTPQPR